LDIHTLEDTAANNNNVDNGPSGRNHHLQQQQQQQTMFCFNVSFQHLLHILDITVLMIVVAYIWHAQKTNHNNDYKMNLKQIVVILTGILLVLLIMLRGLLFCVCWWWFHSVQPSCWKQLTLILCGSYTILAITAWIIVSTTTSSSTTSTVPWCYGLGNWCTSHPLLPVVPIGLTFLAITEIIRLVLFFGQGQSPSMDQDPSQPSHDHHHHNHHRPWWWNHRYDTNYDHDNDAAPDAMHESLLFGGSNNNNNNNGQPGWITGVGRRSYRMDDGVGTPIRRWFGQREVNQSNRRNDQDDESVIDYASLNEEWASRSEEDPYWWTREENNR
jgi:hypothetical protein